MGRKISIVALILLGVLVFTEKAVIAGGAFPQTFACPNCDLYTDSPSVSGCSVVTVGPQSLVKSCLGCQAGLAACENKRLDAGGGCVDLSITKAHCGSCGNNCTSTPDTPSCLSGTCGCAVAHADLCGTNRFCENTSKKCQACPAGTANCHVGDDTGVAGDCEKNLLADTSNCGRCGNQCGFHEVCSNGVCMCGTSPSCQFPQTCDGNACVACVSPTEDVLCSKQNPFDVSGFCNSATKTCDACPAGFADCVTTALGGGADTGSPTDCETSIVPTGIVSNCGGCGLICGHHGAQTCCAGTCKCGKFVSNLSPTNDECAAASQCKSTEYCDEQHQACLPLNPLFEVCALNAIDPLQDDAMGFANLRTCGNCNRALGLANVVNNVCQAFNDSACGAKGEKCRDGQRCFKGKCQCIINPANFLSWSPMIDQDPDRDNKFDTQGRPASGCSAALMTPLFDGYMERVTRLILAFKDCISRSAIPTIDRFTVENFADPGFRAVVCPGGAGQCSTLFCNELQKNLTVKEKGAFCSVAEDTVARFKSCAINYRLNSHQQGDLTCANVLAAESITNNPTTFGFLDAFNFLGCRGVHSNMTIFVGGQNKNFMYRAETAQLLLGGAFNTQASILFVAVILVSSLALLWM